jgi:hypothetical protein
VRYLPSAYKEHFLAAKLKDPTGPGGRWLDLGNGFGLYLSDANKRMAMKTHNQLDTPSKLKQAKHVLSLFFKGQRSWGGYGGHGAPTKAAAERNLAARRNAKNRPSRPRPRLFAPRAAMPPPPPLRRERPPATATL